MKHTILCILALVLGTCGPYAHSQQMTGRQIAEAVYNRDDGKDGTFQMQMLLVDKNGRTRERELVIKSKDEGEKVNTFIEFMSPADIRQTRFLTLENPGEDDTQYLFLPAVGRARRIVSGQKSQSFVNTDFTYEDMQRRHPDEDDHKLIREEAFGEWQCHLIEATPTKAADSQYSKRLVWVHKESFVVVRVDFFDKKDKLCKQLKVSKLTLQSDIWTAMATTMETLKRQTTTHMNVKQVAYNQGLDDGVFSVRQLEEK